MEAASSDALHEKKEGEMGMGGSQYDSSASQTRRSCMTARIIMHREVWLVPWCWIWEHLETELFLKAKAQGPPLSLERHIADRERRPGNKGQCWGWK